MTLICATKPILSSLKLNERSEGTGQPLITQSLLNEIEIPIPEDKIILEFESIAISLFKNSDLITKELYMLEKIKNILLSKLSTITN